MAGWRKDGISFRYPRTLDGERLDIVPPLGVMLMIPLSALWLTWYLVIVLFRDGTAPAAIPMALAGGVAPILVGYAVITNRTWSKHLFAVSLALFVLLVVNDSLIPNEWPRGFSLVTTIAGLIWWGMTTYLYFSKPARAYFMALTGNPLPADLANVTFNTPNWIVSSFSIFALVTEWLMVLLALAVIVVGLMSTA